jgi:hypothetical protein
MQACGFSGAFETVTPTEQAERKRHRRKTASFMRGGAGCPD